MFCNNCGNKLIENAKFCDGCGAGTEQDLRCNACDTLLIKNAKFCDNCGAKSQTALSEHNKAAVSASWMDGVAVLSKIPRERRLLVLILCAAAIFVIGWLIINSFSNPLVGRWVLVQVLDGPSHNIVQEIEFFSDGSGIMGGVAGFTWRTEGNRIIITDRLGGAQVLRYSVSGSTLTVIYDEFTNHRSIYRRIR
jgi:hypothetical protein